LKKIGATSLVNVTCFDEVLVVSAWLAGSRSEPVIAKQKMAAMMTRVLFIIDGAPFWDEECFRYVIPQ
jgi:hypothetical protein